MALCFNTMHLTPVLVSQYNASDLIFQYVDVQPNDGFGTLLPLETVELDIIFKPTKAKIFNFELTMKSLINR